MAKRNEPARRPAAPGEWTIKLATTSVAKGWEDLCRQVPKALATFYDRAIKYPRDCVNRDRQGRLRGQLATGTIKGQILEQWQYEITSGGRIWYCVDDVSKTVWITEAAASHPKQTE